MRTQRGQAMAEYLVVSSALIGAFFWVANEDCPGYDSCLSNVLTVMHDNYQGYSHSMSAVHRYGEFQGEGFDSSWTDDDDSSGGGSSGGGGDVSIPTEGLVNADLLTSLDGATSYGTLVGGQYVVDSDGTVIGTYDSVTGEVTLNNGDQYYAQVSPAVVDEDGNVVELEAVVNCFTGQVLGFGYQSGATGNFHNSLTLEEMDISGFCTAPSYGIVDTDGSLASGAIVGDQYYASTFTVEVDASEPLVSSGEVVYFNVTVPDEDEYASSDPAIGEVLVDCAVMGAGWDADPDVDPLDSYLNADPNARIGSLDPAESIPCPATTTVTD